MTVKYFHVRDTIAFTSTTGVPRVLAKDEIVPSNDPDFKVLQKRGQLEPMEKWLTARGVGVEEATAEPGAHRAVSTAPKKMPDKEPDRPAPAGKSAVWQANSPKGDTK